jgi:HEAT repeat protein
LARAVVDGLEAKLEAMEADTHTRGSRAANMTGVELAAAWDTLATAEEAAVAELQATGKHAEAVGVRMQDADHYVRCAAAEALGCLSLAAAPHAAGLAAALADEDDAVQQAAAASLGRLGVHAGEAAGTVAMQLEHYE